MLVGSPLTDTTSCPVLQVRGLAIDLSQTPTTTRRVVDHASFDIAKGTIVGLRGESGCGKTTLALSLLILLPPNRYRVSGSILIHNREVRSQQSGDSTDGYVDPI
jgi:ABC-type glutathione transport system ATPase component